MSFTYAARGTPPGLEPVEMFPKVLLRSCGAGVWPSLLLTAPERSRVETVVVRVTVMRHM
eukprot:1313271-Pyramimonas_sp.AAC.1